MKFSTLSYELFSPAINNFLIWAKSSIIETRNKPCTILLQQFLQYNLFCQHSTTPRSLVETMREETKCLNNRRFVYPEVSTSFNRERIPIALRKPLYSLCEANSLILPWTIVSFPIKNGTKEGEKAGKKKRRKEREVKIYVIIYA